MTVRFDPEGRETLALSDLIDFAGRGVLEIGCGDGRLTWRYAAQARHVLAIDPFAPSIERARLALPHDLQERVEFHHIGFEEFASAARDSGFEAAIFSWSL